MLGVAKNADQKQIKDAFRDLALKYHPDRNKEADSEERFKGIAEAYAILSNPKKRAEYDARGFAGVAGTSQEDLFNSINFEDIFGGLNFDFGSDNLFGGLFRHHRKGPSRGANIEVDLYVTLDRIVHGGEEIVHFNRPVTCHACHGTGGEGGVAPRQCETCGGTGRITHSQRKEEEHVLIQHIVPCSTCGGRGSINEHPCPECTPPLAGLGIPFPGIRSAIPSSIPTGIFTVSSSACFTAPLPVSGDLLVLVHSSPDPRFEREGADLLRTEILAIPDAVLGTTLKVPTLLDGLVDVTIPLGTQPDTVLRLKGKGLPVFGSNQHGDLYLRISLRVPQHLSKEERELYEQLRTVINRQEY